MRTDLLRKACETDDTTILDDIVLDTDERNLSQFYTLTRLTAIGENAANVLNWLIERSVSVKDVSPSEAYGDGNTSKATLEFLLAHGWDINIRQESSTSGGAKPFMWRVTGDVDMVAWCLEKGASVHPRNQEPLQDDILTQSQRHCLQILERTAAYGSVATFKLLRSRGAPLGWRPLHLAVETATHGEPDQTEAEGETEKERQNRFDHIERMEMVRYLLDVVGLDVNASDQPADGRYRPEYYGTPICYIPSSGMLERDTRELTWLLLDRGADPTPALKIALNDFTKFAEDVEAWKAHQGRQCQ